MASALSLFSFLASPILDVKLAPASRASTIASTEISGGTFDYVSFRTVVKVVGAWVSLNHPICLRL